MKILKILIGIALSFSTAFIGIGYAQLSSTISLEATITGTMQNGVFISNVTEPQGVTINTYFSTVLNSVVVLANSNETKTLMITLYNNSSDEYVFKSVVYDAGIVDAYSNPNITFTHTLQQNQKIAPNGTLEFTITFAFKDGYTPATSESLHSILNFYFGFWDGAELLPDDVVGENHKVLVENILGSDVGLNNENSSLSNKVNNRIDRGKYTFGSMGTRENAEMEQILGTEAKDLSFIIYSPPEDTSVRYLYTTSCNLGGEFYAWETSKNNYPIGERIYPIYRTKLVYQVVGVDENNTPVYDWVGEKTVLGSAQSEFYDNTLTGSLLVKNPAFDPTTFMPTRAEDCEEGEEYISPGKSIENAIYIPLGTTVDEVADSTDKTYFKYQAQANRTVTITPTEKSELLTISVYSDKSLTTLVVSDTGKQISFNTNATTYYIIATGDTEVNFTIQ